MTYFKMLCRLLLAVVLVMAIAMPSTATATDVFEDFTNGSVGFETNSHFSVSGGRLLFKGDGTTSGFMQSWDSGTALNSNIFLNFNVSADIIWQSGSRNYGFGLETCIQANRLGTLDHVSFLIADPGYYMIYVVRDGIKTTLVDWTQSTLVNPRGLNNLSVSKVEDTFRFSINGTSVKQLTISQFYGGAIGLEMNDAMNAAIDNFRIVNLPPSDNALKYVTGTYSDTGGMYTVTVDSAGRVSNVKINASVAAECHMTLSDPWTENELFSGDISSLSFASNSSTDFSSSGGLTVSSNHETKSYIFHGVPAISGNPYTIAFDQTLSYAFNNSVGLSVQSCGGAESKIIALLYNTSLVNGACGSSNGATLTSTPTNLCNSGTPSTPTGTGPWSWTCAGTKGGTTASCIASKSVQTWTINSGTSGNGTVSCTSPVNNGATSTCTVTPATGYQLATFTDNSVDKKSSVSGNSYSITNVTANHTIAATFTVIPVTPVNGSCGPSDGATLSTTPTNLCTTGTSTTPTGTGPWYWSCAGTNGGSTASCSAYSGTTASTGGTLITENFDSVAAPSLPSGWQSSSSSSAAWYTNSGTNHPSGVTAHSSSNLIYFNSYYVTNGNTDNLISPLFSLTNAAGGKVSFWMYRDTGYSNKADLINVYVNTTSSLSGASLLGTVNRSTTLSPTVASAGWYQYSFDIPGTYNSATNYLIINGVSAYGNDIHLDDITVSAVSSGTMVNGSCGSSNGATVASAPTGNFCTTGTASTPTGTGPWSWICAGSGGGTSATCSASNGSGSGSTLNNGLVAYYPFNGNANDESGNGNNGTVYGATQTVDRFGNPNSAYEFNGVSSYINLGNSTRFDVNYHTISAWIVYKHSYQSVIFGKVKPLIYETINLYVNNEQLTTSFATGTETNHTIKDTTTLTQGQLYFVAMTYDGSLVSFYINGVLSSFFPRTGTVRTNSNNLAIGRHGGDINQLGDDFFFKGTIDDVRIYNRALTPTEIAQLYNAQTSTPSTGTCGNSNGATLTSTCHSL